MSWGIDTTKVTSETDSPVSRGTFGTIPTFLKWLVVSLVVLILLLCCRRSNDTESELSSFIERRLNAHLINLLSFSLDG